MLQSLTDLFWNPKKPLAHADFVRGLTLLVIVAMNGIVETVGFQLLRAWEYGLMASTSTFFEFQFYDGVSQAFIPDLIGAVLLFGCLMLFAKRAAAIRLGAVFALTAGALVFVFFRSCGTIPAIISYATQSRMMHEPLGVAIPVVAWTVSGLAFCGLALLVFFCLRRVPEDRRESSPERRMTPQRLVRFFWLLLLVLLCIDLVLVAALAALGMGGLFSRVTYQIAVVIAAGITSLTGQIVLAMAFGRRLKDAGYSPWMVLVAIVALSVVQGLAVWGMFSAPPPAVLQALNLALLLTINVGAAGVITLFLLPSRERDGP